MTETRVNATTGERWNPQITVLANGGGIVGIVSGPGRQRSQRLPARVPAAAGRFGNDICYLGNAEDQVIQAESEGIDKVLSSIHAVPDGA